MQSPAKEQFRIGALLLLLLIVAFYDVVFLGKTFKVTTANSQALPTGAYGQEKNKPKFIPVNGTDSPVMEEPLLQFIKNNLRRGVLPLWDPHQACGYPLIGMLELGMFFPLHFIFYLLPSIYSWDLLILSRLFLAGLFTFWFMRRIGFKNVPSLCAGIVFMLSGPLTLLQYWTTNVDMVTPLLLIASDQLIRRPQRRNVVYLAVGVALTFFAGHPEHIFLVNTLNVCFFIFRLLSTQRVPADKKDRRDYIKHLGKILLCFILGNILGLSLSSIVLLPFVQNLLSEFWHAHPPGTGLLMEEQRERALTLALPHFFQEVPLNYKWVFSGWWGGYLGTLPLGFSFLSLFNKQKKGLNYFFATMTFFMIAKQYGLPIINWIGHLPVFNVCRYAIHTPALTAFSVAVLTGMGVRAALFNRRTFYKALPYSIGLLLIALLHLVYLKSTGTFPIALRATFFAVGVLTVFQALLFLKDKKILNREIASLLMAGIIFAELFLYIHRERPRRFDSFLKVPYIEFLKSDPERIRSYGIFWAFYPNTASGFAVDDLGIFLSLLSKRFVNFSNHLLIKNNFKNDLRPPALRTFPIPAENYFILDLLNVKYMIAPSREWLSKVFPKFVLPENPIYSKEVNVYLRPTAFPRTFIVHRVVFQPDGEKSFALLKELGPQLRNVAVINSPTIPAVTQHLQTVPLLDDSSAEIVQYTPNKVVIKAHLEHPGLLVFSDAYHPDWKAYADETEVRIFRADYLLRSIFLPEGNHKVEFVFKPVWFYIGGGVSFFSFLFLVALYIPKKGQRPFSTDG